MKDYAVGLGNCGLKKMGGQTLWDVRTEQRASRSVLLMLLFSHSVVSNSL